MTIKCKLDCRVVDCQNCSTLDKECEKWCQKMLVFERNRIAGASDVGLYNCFLDVQKEKKLVEAKIKFYEEKLRERGLLSVKKEEKIVSEPAAVSIGDWSC